jgi:hypothetical protein
MLKIFLKNKSFHPDHTFRINLIIEYEGSELLQEELFDEGVEDLFDDYDTCDMCDEEFCIEKYFITELNLPMSIIKLLSNKTELEKFTEGNYEMVLLEIPELTENVNHSCKSSLSIQTELEINDSNKKVEPQLKESIFSFINPFQSLI